MDAETGELGAKEEQEGTRPSSAGTTSTDDEEISLPFSDKNLPDMDLFFKENPMWGVLSRTVVPKGNSILEKAKEMERLGECEEVRPNQSATNMSGDYHFSCVSNRCLSNHFRRTIQQN